MRVLIVVFRSAIELAISLVAFIVAIAPIPALANVEAPNSAAYQEVRVPLDPETKAAAGEDVCLGRPGCYPGYSAAISVTSDYVLAGSNEGWLRAFDINNGEVLWELDTTQPFTSVDGRKAQGGSIGGGQAPLIVGDRLILNSGYAFAGKMPGNA